MIICVLRFMYTQSVLVLGSKFNFTSSEPRRNRSPKGSPSFGFCCRLLAQFELSQCTRHSNLLSHRGFWDRAEAFNRDGRHSGWQLKIQIQLVIQSLWFDAEQNSAKHLVLSYYIH